MHEVRGEHHGERDRQRRDHPRSQAAKHHEQHDDHQRPAFHQVRHDGADRSPDERRAIVDDFQPHAVGQRRRDLVEPRLDPLDDAPRVFADEHHHQTGNGLAAGVARDGSLPREFADAHLGQIANEQRRPVLLPVNDDVLDVRRAGEHGLPANESLLVVVHRIAAAGGRIIRLNRRRNVLQRQRMARQAFRLGPHLEAFVVAPVGVDLGHAANFPQLRRDVPFQHRAQFRGGVAVAAHFKLQHLAQRRG